MPNTTMTLALNGEIPLDLFTQAMGHFRGLVYALAEEISPAAHIEWFIEDLVSSSAQATVRGESSQIEAVEPIPSAFLAVGRALADGRPVPYSPRVAKEALAIADVLNGKVTSIRFETEEDDATVSNPTALERRASLVGSYGAVEGRVQTLTSRNSLKFTLYDAVHDRAVSCSLQDGRQDVMRDAWDRRAIVEGWVSRDSETGRPVTIRRIRQVTLNRRRRAGDGDQGSPRHRSCRTRRSVGSRGDRATARCLSHAGSSSGTQASSWIT
jgi:hypothetical protein